MSDVAASVAVRPPSEGVVSFAHGRDLTEHQGETPSMIVAALLHDVGHMVHALGEAPAAKGINDSHEACGADWLAARVGPTVSEPVRLHVAAKRFLVADEPDYFERLSSDSIRRLELQGGAMRAGSVCLNSFPGFISGASAEFRRP